MRAQVHDVRFLRLVPIFRSLQTELSSNPIEEFPLVLLVLPYPQRYILKFPKQKVDVRIDLLQRCDDGAIVEVQNSCSTSNIYLVFCDLIPILSLVDAQLFRQEIKELPCPEWGRIRRMSIRNGRICRDGANCPTPHYPFAVKMHPPALFP